MVGILALTLEDDMHEDPRFDGYEAYIMKAYVQYFEGIGARVVPIIANESEE